MTSPLPQRRASRRAAEREFVFIELLAMRHMTAFMEFMELIFRPRLDDSECIEQTHRLRCRGRSITGERDTQRQPTQGPSPRSPCAHKLA